MRPGELFLLSLARVTSMAFTALVVCHYYWKYREHRERKAS